MNKTKLLSLALAIFFLSSYARADQPAESQTSEGTTDTAWYAGVFLGINSMSPDPGSSPVSASIDIGAKIIGTPVGKISLGVNTNGYTVDRKLSGTTSSQSMIEGTGELSLRQICNTGGRVGVRGGLGFSSFTVLTESASRSDFIYGGVIGYDYSLNSVFAIGAEVSYVHIPGGKYTYTLLGTTASYSDNDEIRPAIGAVFHW